MNNNDNNDDWERIAVYTLGGFAVLTVAWFMFLAAQIIG